MNYQIPNQTLDLVKREIDKFLANFPDDHPYQMAMFLPYFRQILEDKIAREVLVLSHELVILENGIEFSSPQFSLKLLGGNLFIEDEICLMMPNIIQNTHLDKTVVDLSQIRYYLTTDLQGTIQNISFNICQLFNLKREKIIGQSLLFFVPQRQWKNFYYYLDNMKQNTSNKEITEVWSMQLETFQSQASTSKLINVEIETTVHRNSQGDIIGWHWLLQEISQGHVNHLQTFQLGLC